MDDSLNYIKTDWKNILSFLFSKEDFSSLMDKVNYLYKTQTVYPPKHLLWNCFNYFNSNDTKVVIIGQDPYINENQANGLAFSVNEGQKLPPSLKNIFKELQSDLGIRRNNPDLKDWAKQGVLLLNSHLTVQAHQSMSHHYLQWDKYTNKVISFLSNNFQNIVYILWGNQAISKKKLINAKFNLILEAAHPSPLSAYHGFFNCKHFSKTNNYLISHNKSPINW